MKAPDVPVYLVPRVAAKSLLGPTMTDQDHVTNQAYLSLF